MLLALMDSRPAHLTRVHDGLVGLDPLDMVRLGVIAPWRHGPHLLTYRQVERTFRLVVGVLDKDTFDGTPSTELRRISDDLLEASIPQAYKASSGALAVDWSDFESFSCPPSVTRGECADTEAAWGRRKSDQPGMKDELFFGYELQAATMVNEEAGPAVPELTRRILLTTCSTDPPPAFVPVLADLVSSGVAVTDVLSDSGYAYRIAEHWAVPLRVLGARIVTDLHPNDRGPRGTFKGAIICNGNLYCPATPAALLGLGPLSRQSSSEQTSAHDEKTAELSRYKLGRTSSDDADGFARVMCPAVMGKLRCPLRGPSMALSHERPEVLSVPEHPPACCCQRPSPSNRVCTRRPHKSTTTPHLHTGPPTRGAPL